VSRSSIGRGSTARRRFLVGAARVDDRATLMFRCPPIVSDRPSRLPPGE